MKERQSNIELLRIVSMLMIVLLHTNYFSLGAVDAQEIISSPITSFLRALAEQLCIVGVNVFILISGWFGIRPSLKGFLNLMYQILFWGISLLILGWVFHKGASIGETIKVLYFGGYYWFIPAYIGLYVISPVLNTYVENISRTQFLLALFAFYFFEFVFGWITNLSTYQEGYSIISFIGLYLLARYVKQYCNRLIKLNALTHFSAYLGFSIIPTVLFIEGTKHLDIGFCALKYTSPFVIAAALSLLLCFNKMQFKNRVLNLVAASAFSVYLAHMHPVVMPFLKDCNVWMYEKLGHIYPVYCLVLSLTILVICTILDQARVWSWKAMNYLFLDKTVAFIERKCISIIDSNNKS